MKAKEIRPIGGSGSYHAEKERAENVIGSRIAEARKLRGWNQAVFCDTLKNYGVNLTKAAVQKIQSHQRRHVDGVFCRADHGCVTKFRFLEVV